MSGKLVLITRGVVTPPPPPAGPQRYVSPSGNNSNSGTSALTPWLTMPYAWSQLVPDDTLNMMQGTHLANVGSGTTLPSGTAGHPITIKAYSGFGTAVWATNTGDGNFPLIDPAHGEQYITFTDIIFDGYRSGARTVKFLIGGANDPSHWIFNNCEFMRSTLSGVNPHGSYWDFNNCLGHDCGTTSQDHILYLPCNHCTVDGGEYYNSSGYGIHIFDVGSGSISNNTVKNAIIHNCDSGLIMTSGADNIAFNNRVYSNTLTGMTISESGTSTNGQMYNNVCYANGGFGMLIGANSTGGIMENNISYANGSTDIHNLGASSTLSNNTITSTPGNPNFTNAAAHDFTLGVGSNSIGNGLTLSSIFTTNCAGATRTVPWNRGAF